MWPAGHALDNPGLSLCFEILALGLHYFVIGGILENSSVVFAADAASLQDGLDLSSRFPVTASFSTCAANDLP